MCRFEDIRAGAYFSVRVPGIPVLTLSDRAPIGLANSRRCTHIGGMSKFSLILTVMAAVAFGSVATALPDPATSVGRSVFGVDGVVLGVVEKVILNSKGRPAQVLVHPKGKKSLGPRSLAIDSLDETAEGFVAPLTRAEFDAMPAVELDTTER